MNTRPTDGPCGVPLLERALEHAHRTALVDFGGPLSYRELLVGAERAASWLLDRLAPERRDLDEARVALLVTPSAQWVVAQWAVWRAGGVAVPLCVSHPAPELEHVLRDSDAALVVCSEDLAALGAEAARRVGCAATQVVELAGHKRPGSLPSVLPTRRALVVYTSGTTGRPKGVVATHANLSAQMSSLVEAWEWRAGDRILEVLPLHHVHGIVNVVGCSLWSGACCEIQAPFEAEAVWQRLASGEITLFMAVPTIYAKLIEAWRRQNAGVRHTWSRGARGLRLMVSGSAALPERVLREWQEITGHRLLERYGMSETGMILSNALHGERVAGSVGAPLPGVEVRFAGGGERTAEGGVQGELEVRGRSVFLEYWRREAETQRAFTADGWFRTGDVAELRDGRYRLLGRTSTDILKTGGYKVSALEIEEALREHPKIRECAVVGLPDEEWGQRVAVAVLLRPGAAPLSLDELRAWGKERLAPYKVPTRLVVLDDLPRNALGKVVKGEVVERLVG
jgi:malonyl-CoA/methylmalonyl-CoA synthetase